MMHPQTMYSPRYGCSFLLFTGRWDGLIWRIFFTKDILKGKVIPVFEAANHRTVASDFTYIDDVVKGCLGALDTAEKNTGSGRKKRGPAQLRVFNLGNTPLVPVSDLVGILERLWKVKARRMVMKLPRNGDVSFTHADISLARREFGYRTTTDLQTGLEKFVRWCVSYYGAGCWYLTVNCFPQIILLLRSVTKEIAAFFVRYKILVDFDCQMLF
ncbi:putative UDP-glucuronate 4-epimerase [Helianthus annuus]|nr:putative UDP-glucuronate 4-epimerase [Helianthus annuus]